MKRFSVIVLLVVLIATSAFAERTVKIESAKTSEYLKKENSPATDGGGNDGESERQKSEIVRFRGSVVISVTDGESVSKISADEVVYDKTEDTLEARGNVTYEHSSGKSGSEKFVGNALLFNIKKQEGVFLDGVVTQDTGSDDSDPYVIHSSVSGRNSGSTMAFKDGVLTTCDADDPHWSINASRIWLLPGNEIALLNGVFFVGPLPVFYLPFFYYPADEMIFHPVFGYRDREGYFVQTTTYLYGRKPVAVKADEKNTFANFLQSSTLKEQKQNGLFLTNLEEDAKSDTNNYFKVMFDAYSVLGGLAGFEGSFASDSLLKSLTVNSYFGFSRTLYPRSSGSIYSSYDTGGKQNWNTSWIFGYKVPFRNRTNISLSLNKSPVQFSLNMPFVSDLAFKEDFLDRSENLNWFTLLLPSTDDDDTTVTTETSYSWTATGSLTPDMSFATPWIKTLSISSLSGTLTFNSKTNSLLSGDDLTYAPDRTFFYPEILKPEVKFSFGGTLFTTESKGNAKKTAAKKVDTGGLTDPFKATGDEKTTDENAKKGDDTPKKADPVNPDLYPSAGITYSAENDGRKKSVFALTWAATPLYTQEVRYNAQNWTNPSKINWNEFSSIYYQIKTTANLTGTYTFDTDFLTATSALEYTNNYQTHPLLSGSSYSTDALKNVVKLADYKATIFKLNTTDSIKIMPFNRIDLLKPVAVSWAFNGSLVKSSFSGTVTSPSWKQETIQWTDDFVEDHNTTLVTGVNIMDLPQTLTITSNLPPLQESYAETMAFNWGFGTLAMTTKLYDSNSSEDIKEWDWDPFAVTLSWKLPYDAALGQEFSWNIEDKKPIKLGFTGSWSYLSAYYTITNSVPYVLKTGSGWVLDGSDSRFIPSAAGIVFSNSAKPFSVTLWKNRLTLVSTLTSNLKFNLLQLTDSSLIFTPAITFKIYDFIDVSFSTNSTNEVIARYMQGILNLPERLPGESNALVDLVKSFNFLSTADRTASGYKLKKLNIAVVHYLHDWTMTYKTTLAPKLKTSSGKYYYEFTPTISFVVQWKPISDIKTTVRSKEGVFTLNTASSTSTTTTSDTE